MISINNVTRFYGSKRALRDISFTVEKGETLGILGPNGSGKTTLINILLGLLRADEGSVTIDGKEIWSNREALLPKIGAIIEIPRLYPFLSGRENLKIFAEYLAVEDSPQKIEEVLGLVGLEDVGKLPFKNYSLGMKQRLGIALSLLNDPDILVFDEPTNGLDPEGILTVRETIKKLSGMGKTIILCSHLIYEVEQVCQSVVILQNGDLKKSISSKELENRDHLFHLEVSESGYESCVRFCESNASIEIIHTDSKLHTFRLKIDSNVSGSEILKKIIESKISVEAFYKDQVPLEELFMEAVKS
jgi:ABC-type multidrug transport system ATPase subunit